MKLGAEARGRLSPWARDRTVLEAACWENGATRAQSHAARSRLETVALTPQTFLPARPSQHTPSTQTSGHPPIKQQEGSEQVLAPVSLDIPKVFTGKGTPMEQTCIYSESFVSQKLRRTAPQMKGPPS